MTNINKNIVLFCQYCLEHNIRFNVNTNGIVTEIAYVDSIGAEHYLVPKTPYGGGLRLGDFYLYLWTVKQYTGACPCQDNSKQ